jgi:hypothetical protein
MRRSLRYLSSAMGRRALTELPSQGKQAPVQAIAVVDQMSGSSSLPKKKRRRFARIAADLPQASLQLIASGAAAIIPISTFAMSHTELAGLEPTPESILIHLPTILLILCGLAYSAPTVAEWAFLWTFSRAKAWAFTLC